MYSILIDSHSEKINIVLYKNKVKVIERCETFNKQSKIIVPLILEVLDEEGISFDNITEIIVVNGPGSFTGTRLSVTIAKTIAYSMDIAIKSISSISLLAINVNNDNDYSIAIPDQKGFFIGEYTKDNELKKEYFYLTKDEYSNYKNDHQIIDDININWDNIYKYNCLKNEDCYNIKPLYIKKIEVEK